MYALVNTGAIGHKLLSAFLKRMARTEGMNELMTCDVAVVGEKQQIVSVTNIGQDVRDMDAGRKPPPQQIVGNLLVHANL